MKNSDLEVWVLNILNRVEKMQPIEDSRVELKKEWPDDYKRAARRIAGHANASRGELILWIIGVDEKSGVIVGADRNDLANWFPQVRSQFADGIWPNLKDLVIPVPSRNISVVALLFETDRPPYIVNGNGGQVDREVPWREGTSVRSAHRHDLLKILVEQQATPEIEILTATVALSREDGWLLRIDAYIVTKMGQTLIIPFHRCSAVLESSSLPFQIEFKRRIRLRPPQAYSLSGAPTNETDSFTVKATATELLVSGSGLFTLTSHEKYTEGDVDFRSGEPFVVKVDLPIAMSDIVVHLNIPMRLWESNKAPAQIAFWGSI